jgi:hypothetical protein
LCFCHVPVKKKRDDDQPENLKKENKKEEAASGTFFSKKKKRKKVAVINGLAGCNRHNKRGINIIKAIILSKTTSRSYPIHSGTEGGGDMTTGR